MIKVLFAGNTDFSQYVFDGLYDRFDIVGLITAPDKPSGRGLKHKELKIAAHAREKNVTILKPPNLKDASFLEEIKLLAPDVFVVVAFRKLPELLWRIPLLGTLNLHTSLLPKYRGAAPIQHAIINGDKETGVTSFLISDRMDAGDILLQKSTPILPGENFGDVYQKLKPVAMDLAIETIKKLAVKQLTPATQPRLPDQELHLAPKITTSFCKISYPRHRTPEQIHNFIRGLSPKPCAWIWLKFPSGARYRYKIITSSFELKPLKQTDRIQVIKDRLGMLFDDGVLWLLKGQLEGKKPMFVSAMVNGWSEKVSMEVYWE